MGLLAFVRTRHYRNFMAKLYGWGASVSNHWCAL